MFVPFSNLKGVGLLFAAFLAVIATPHLFVNRWLDLMVAGVLMSALDLAYRYTWVRPRLAALPPPRRERTLWRRDLRRVWWLSNNGGRVLLLPAWIFGLIVPPVLLTPPSVRLLGSFVESKASRGDTPVKDGVSLPSHGPGFVAGWLFGSGGDVNPRVRDTLLASFAALQAVEPERTFVVGDTGPGRFRLPRTGENGFSVDILMPVRDWDARWVSLPMKASWREPGYSREFTSAGKWGNLSMDFDSVAELLAELDRQAPRHQLSLLRIVVAPEYVDLIVGAKKAPGISRLSGLFMRRPPWARHNDHLHVDFQLKTSPQGG